MDTLAKRVLAARSRLGLTQGQVAELAGLRQPDISKIEKGLIQRTTGLLGLSRALRTDATWLDTGDGDPGWDAEKNNVEPGPDIKGKGRYPLISWVQAGEWTELCDNFQPGDADEWPVSHHNLGECGYFLRVKGHSMTAPAGSGFSFPEGVLLHVKPESDALPGQFVIVRRTAEKEATFKRLSMVDGELFLEAINPDWPRRYLPLKEGDVICGLVVDASFGNLP